MKAEEIKKIYLKLRRLEKLLKASNELPLSMTKAVRYTGLSKSHLYKLTSGREVPHYKPHGKMIFFRKSDLDKYLLTNRIATEDEISLTSAKFLSKVGRC